MTQKLKDIRHKGLFPSNVFNPRPLFFLLSSENQTQWVHQTFWPLFTPSPVVITEAGKNVTYKQNLKVLDPSKHLILDIMTSQLMDKFMSKLMECNRHYIHRLVSLSTQHSPSRTQTPLNHRSFSAVAP